MGVILTVLLGLFLAFDGFTKILRVPPVVEACQKMGLGINATVGIGILLLVIIGLYLVPKTAILGAILLTGYLGGAAVAHLLARSGVFPTAFSIGFGVLVWVGLILREPRLLSWIFLRQ